MGSLLPGWDERLPGVAPKDFQDYADVEEEVGYFAAYEKRKKSMHGGEPSSPTAIGSGLLSRRSMPGDQRRLSPSSSLSRASLPAGSAREFGVPTTPQSARSLSRAETMAAGAGLRRHSQGSGGGGGAGPQGLQRMYSMPVSRGERSDVLGGLWPMSPSAKSSSTPRSPGLDAYKMHQPDKEEKHVDTQWWRQFDSALMNERPDEPESKEKGFTPQFAVTGQGMHFHDADTADLGLSTIQAH